MGRWRLCLLLGGWLLAVSGCATNVTTTFHTGQTDQEKVWVGTVDAVSNYLHVDFVDRERGKIEARSDGVWQRNLARIEIRKNANQYDITVGAYVESSKVFTRPSGLRSAEEEHLSDLNTGLRDTLVAEIKRRLGVPDKVTLAEAPKPAPATKKGTSKSTAPAKKP